eukprot:3715363-Pleurochrysis_carterae.AAC.1
MEPMNSTGRVTPLATLTRTLGLRCEMRLAGRRLRSPLAVRVDPLSTSANRAAADGAGRSRRVGRRTE